MPNWHYRMNSQCGGLFIWTALLILIAFVSDAQGSESSCRCVPSKSRYLTTTPLPATLASATMTPGGAAVTSATTTTPFGNLTQIQLSIGSRLSSAFTDLAFNQSTPGYTYDPASNQFGIPQNYSSEIRLVIDLLIGPTGDICREMPNMDQICVSSACASCNLLKFTASAAPTLLGGSAFIQRVFYPTTVNRSTSCADQAAFKSFGQFRYLVFLPVAPPPDPSQPYAFTINISGNFSSYTCAAARRRRSVDLHTEASRYRRAIPTDCACPVGQDPEFNSVRIVLISWDYPLVSFDTRLSDINSAAYLSLATESYYLLMDTARNLKVSNLTSIIADFFDIAFSANAGGIRLTGKLSIRNEPWITKGYLLAELVSTLPGFGLRISNLMISSLAPAGSSPGDLPAYAVVLICLLCCLVLITALLLILWRFQVIGNSPSRSLTYKPDTGESGGWPEISTQEAVDISKWRPIGATLDEAVQMPATALCNQPGVPPREATYENLGSAPNKFATDNLAFNERAV